jgi:hypothetical protein
MEHQVSDPILMLASRLLLCRTLLAVYITGDHAGTADNWQSLSDSENAYSADQFRRHAVIFIWASVRAATDLSPHAELCAFCKLHAIK